MDNRSKTRRAAWPAFAASCVLASSCAIFAPHYPDVGRLDTPLEGCRSYENLPVDKRSRETFLAFWVPEDAALLRSLEEHIDRVTLAMAGNTKRLAERLPDRHVQAYHGGFQIDHAGHPIRFPLESVSLSAHYSGGGPRTVSYGAPVVIGDSAVVTVIVERGTFQLSMRRVKGRWLRVLDGSERILVLAQRDFLTAMEGWIEGIGRDLNSGALIAETADMRVEAYAGLFLSIHERYLGRD